MMAAFAELERDIIHERTMAGLRRSSGTGPPRRPPGRDGRQQARRRPGAP